MQTGDSDFSVLMGEHFAFCGEKYRLQPATDNACHSCRALADTSLLLDVLDSYAAQYPDADRRASASMWTLYYFSGLVISPVVLWLLHRKTMRLSLGNMSVCLDPDTHLPTSFVVEDFGTDRQAGTIFAAMDEMIHGHAAPMIEALTGAGLSSKLLWTNLVVYVDWVVRQIGLKIDPKLTEEGLALLESEIWPDRGRNPLSNLLRRHSQEGCDEITRRRVCCLRYILPGIPGCGMVCPLPQGRD